MIHKKLKVGHWEVDFLFAGERYDTDEGLDYLYYADAPDYVLRKAYHVMEDNKTDTGFAYSNPDSRMAVVVVGPTSSGGEFVNTLTHEIYHVAVAIAESIGVELDSETPAYISGDTLKSLFSVICELGCRECNK